MALAPFAPSRYSARWGFFLDTSERARIMSGSQSQRDFYQRFVMARANFDPRAFGVDMDAEQFCETMSLEFSGSYQFSFDELLLRPREAIHFCETVRRKHGCLDVPDDIILRAVMRRRKNPG
jgi:hypothetical protein